MNKIRFIIESDQKMMAVYFITVFLSNPINESIVFFFCSVSYTFHCFFQVLTVLILAKSKLIFFILASQQTSNLLVLPFEVI